MDIKHILTDITAAAFEACGYERKFGEVSFSSRPDLCRFQCNGSMSAAKQYKKAPIAIATEIVEIIKKEPLFKEVTAVMPGFINIDLTDEYIAEVINSMDADERLLLPLLEQKTIVVDYGGANIAKPLHVGHLRSAVIGESLYRIAKFLGNNVIGDAHLGDWGLQMGLVFAEIESRMPKLVFFKEDYVKSDDEKCPVSIDELSEIYPTASKKSKVDADFAARAAAMTAELQNGRKGYIALWESIREISVEDLKANYGNLNVNFDYWYGESGAAPYIPKVINILKDKKLIFESDGAMVVDVSLPEDKEPMPPMIIQKSNGADIYGTTDLGTIQQRAEDYSADEIWYVTDNRQMLHFKQVFRCAALAGISENIKLGHYWIGTMNGKDGKPYKTRDGGVMRLSDMIDTLTESSYRKLCESSEDMDEKEKRDTARIVGVGALKFGDMINHRTKDYIFDMDRFLASDGKTGPYLQYCAVRIKSILKKAKESNMDFGVILSAETDSERDLMQILLTVSDTLIRAYDDRAPNCICESLFNIASVFNKFYLENKILSCPDEARRGSWLSLIRLTLKTMEIMLTLVGIDIPDRM